MEQNIATTAPSDSKFKQLIKQVDKILQDPSIEFNRLTRHYDKVRLVFLVVVCNEGVTESDRHRFLEAAGFSIEETRGLTNLAQLDCRLSPSISKQDTVFAINQNPFSVTQIVSRSLQTPSEFENARFNGAVEFILKDQLANRLDSKWFPYLGDEPQISAPSATRKKPSWATRKQQVEEKVETPRTILFMLGGATYSEIKAVADLDCYIGSSHTWVPDSFLEGVKSLGVRGWSDYYGFQRPIPRRIVERTSSAGRENRRNGDRTPTKNDRQYSRDDASSSRDERASPRGYSRAGSARNDPETRNSSSRREQDRYERRGSDRSKHGSPQSTRLPSRSDSRPSRAGQDSRDPNNLPIDRVSVSELKPLKEEPKKKNWFGF